MKRIVATLIALLTCSVALPAAAADLVRLGNLKFAHYGAVSYMKEICGKYNLKVEERVFPKGIDIIPAIIAGEIDIAASAADAAIAGRASGAPVYIVAGFARGGARVVAQAGSTIKTMKDLKGRKVGVARGGAQELLLLAELEKAGLSWSDKPGKDVLLVYLAFADLNQALAARQIDAMCQSEPQSSQAINKKFGVEILKPYDTPMGEPIRALVMTEKMYRDRRDIAERTMLCFVEATSMFRKDMKLAEKYVRDSMFKGQISSDDFRDAMDNAQYTYDISVDHIDITTRLMQKYGVGRMAKPPRAADWVKLDLLQKAKATLKVR